MMVLQFNWLGTKICLFKTANLLLQPLQKSKSLRDDCWANAARLFQKQHEKEKKKQPQTTGQRRGGLLDVCCITPIPDNIQNTCGSFIYNRLNQSGSCITEYPGNPGASVAVIYFKNPPSWALREVKAARYCKTRRQSIVTNVKIWTAAAAGLCC